MVSNVFFIPTRGNDPIWLYNMFQLDWSHHLVFLMNSGHPVSSYKLGFLPAVLWVSLIAFTNSMHETACQMDLPIKISEKERKNSCSFFLGTPIFVCYRAWCMVEKKIAYKNSASTRMPTNNNKNPVATTDVPQFSDWSPQGMRKPRESKP